MSYDLWLRGKKSPAWKDWFHKRANYSLQGKDFNYFNQKTGVYFHVTLSDHIFFNINFARPDFFALEAAEELDALVLKFGLTVEDPQSDGMGEGPWSKEGFLRGWRYGNAFACTLNPSGLRLPESLLTACWQWNRAIPVFQDDLSCLEMSPCFVPSVVLIRQGESAVPAVMWPDEMAVALPEVLGVLLLSGADSGKPKGVLVKREQLEPLLVAYKRQEAAGFACRLVEDEPLPEGLSKEIQRLIEEGQPLQKGAILSWDSVVGSE
jgi:hypothetical protein